MKSEFDGGLFGLIAIGILCFCISTFTFGLGIPWAIVLGEKWVASHTVIDGRRLVFTGSGTELFLKYIIWYILTIITFGIYGFWLAIKLKKWIISNTHFADDNYINVI